MHGEYLKRLFLVRKCVSCREILDHKRFGDALCPRCRDEFEAAKTQSCPECFGAACECSCQPSMLSKAGALTLRKLFFYSAKKDNEAQNKIIYFLKRTPNKRGFGFCAEQIWKAVRHRLSLRKNMAHRYISLMRSLCVKFAENILMRLRIIQIYE